MSATADKARYYLEQSVPELKEYERKKIFTPAEISSIAKRRSDFEHKINARGSIVADYIQYAEFEINVDALREKRVKRLGIKTTTHNGQRRIFFVFGRGTRKFSGDVGLWMQSIEYARRQKAYKKASEILTSALRLHPNRADLWIYGASCAMEDKGDMNEARSFMQRGLRFNRNSQRMWLEDVRLEVAYIAKIHARRQILGLGPKFANGEQSVTALESEDLILLPKITAEDVNPHLGHDQDVDEAALRKLEDTHIMSGAIPTAIFDSAMKHFKNDAAIGHAFFEVVAESGHIPTVHKLLNHIWSKLQEVSTDSWHTMACGIALPLLKVSPTDPEYPAALRHALQQLTNALAVATAAERANLVNWCRSWLETQLGSDLDPGIEAVLRSKLRSLG